MRRKLLSLTAVFVLVLGACSSTPATQAPASAAPSAAPTAAATAAPSAAASAAASGATGGSVSINRFAEANPVFHTVEAQSNQYMLYYLVFDTLAALDLSDKTLQTIKPRMAESWEIAPDAKTFTFHLRKDIKWQDGQPFTSKDVVYTATWAAENKNGYVGFPPAWFSLSGQADAEKACETTGKATDPAACGGTAAFPGVSAPDDYTVVFKLDQPDVFFLRTMVDAPSVILPEHLLKGMTLDQINKSDFKNKAPVGTGPFSVKAIVPDQYIEFDANPNYYLGAPKLDKIFYKAIKTDTALAQLQSGELDIALNVGASNLDSLSKVSILNVQTVQAPGIFTLVPFDETDADRTQWNKDFKLTLPPVSFNFSDKRVRQAMYFAIDRNTINTQLFGGRNRILWNPPGFKADYPDLEHYDFNPDKAKALLAAATADGKVDLSKHIRFMYATDLADGGKIAPIVKQNLEAVGFHVDLQAVDIDTYNTLSTTSANRDKYDMSFGAGGSEGLSPSRSQIYFHCNTPNLEDPVASAGYYNCDLRNLFLKARTQVDPAAQDATYHQIAKILNDDLPQLYLWQLAGVHAVNKRVQGVQVPSFERYVTIDAVNWSVTS
jgi:peptide/nickel transport system substrate-binding protein